MIKLCHYTHSKTNYTRSFIHFLKQLSNAGLWEKGLQQ